LPTDATQYRYLMDVTTVDPGDLQQLPVSSIADLGDFTPVTTSPGAFPPPGKGSAGQNGIGSGLYDNNGAGGGWDSYSARIASVKAGDFWTIAAAGYVGTRAVGVGDRITAKQLAPSEDETATGWLYEAAGSTNVPAEYATGINAPIAYRIKLYNQTGAGASTWQQSDDYGATWYNILPSYINAAAMHLTAIEQTYLNVVNGAGNADQRLIARAFPYTFVAITEGNPACLDWGGGVANNCYPCLSPDTAWITVYLYSVFGTTLVANVNGDGKMNNGYNGVYWPPNSHWEATIPPGGQSFVQIDNNCRQYSADSWPLKGFS
jgi:hypothetical protein